MSGTDTRLVYADEVYAYGAVEGPILESLPALRPMTAPAERAAGSAQALNLALRLLLELCALAAMAFWGWSQTGASWRYALMLAIPALAAGAWGTFAVPDDPSRSGRAPVPVWGVVRLGIELAFFGFACWALYDTGEKVSGLTLAVVVVHYALSQERLRWLLSQPRPA